MGEMENRLNLSFGRASFPLTSLRNVSVTTSWIPFALCPEDGFLLLRLHRCGTRRLENTTD